SDSDGLVNLLDPDSDNDGFTDEKERLAATDPADPASFPAIPAGNALYLKSATTNNSIVFTDESGEGHAITRYGDTKHVIFGSNTAIRYDGNGDYLKTPASSDWDFGTGDFTIDVWVYFTSTPDNFDGIFSAYKQSGASGGYLMQVTGGMIQWYAPGTTGWMNTGVAPVVGQWFHLAAVRSANMLTIYVNGVDRVHQTCTGKSFNSSSDGMVLGRLYTLTTGSYFTGYMDEMRVTKGFALWTGNFTPPNSPAATDTDADGISDLQETDTYLTNPNDADSDDDGMQEGAELNYWDVNWNTDYDGDAATFPNNLLDPDSDNDGLNDGTEVNTHGSDPSNVDTDSDGLDDGLEVNTYGTDPVLADSDGDAMNDGSEVAFWAAHPTAAWNSDSDSDGAVNLLDPDSDGDGFNDEKERIAATDPADSASFPVIPAGNALYLKSATTNNSIVFTDESGAGHAITRFGDTKHVTFGADTAIQFDGNGDYLKTPANADWDFGTGDFTIDVWVYFTSTPDNFDGIFSTYKKSGASGGYL
ncbi:MAG: LamG-like jellyroll fold domain-containing protein, partial [Desulfosalsimonadaceae bacterium]|nr:LamG-like jellyroll fold domain-containing protein [Desulfosalsimonadaceae bacterium]